MVALLASFLITLGLLQLIAVYFRLRGASLTGSLAGPGILIGVVILMAGVYLAVDEPWWVLLLAVIPSLPVAIFLLVIAGVILNLGWNPSAECLHPEADARWTCSDVSIPVQLTHVAVNAAITDQCMPATFLRPKSWDEEGFDGRGSAVLLVCGAGDTRTSFKWLLFRELLSRNLAVLTIDPPGHGDFRSAPMTVANARAACEVALEWLCQQPGVAHVGACGISFGGNQVAALAAEDTRVRAVALVSTPVRLNTLTRRIYLFEAASLFIWPRNVGLLRQGSLLTLWREWQALKGAWYGESLYDMIERYDTLAAVRAIGTRPTLFIHGSRDVAIPPLTARTLYEAAAPQRDLMLVRQATHISPILYPREMARMAAWFDRWLNYNHSDAQQAV
ncbi:MAG: alpha/beta fold hydrolase [Chloroflexi bacterium]|nr:alpha/beta fold hydrolase [Chloroflexota bacterium]